MTDFNGTICYVAGPYRAAQPYMIVENIRLAKAFGDQLIRRGIMPLVPHKNTEHCEGLGDAQFFIEGTKELLRRCDAIFVVPGFQNSVGTLGEIEEAKKLEIPIFFNLKEVDEWLS